MIDYSAMEPTAVRVPISPTMARDMLKRNTHNRNINNRYVDDLVRDMLAGNFKENGDTIRFDVNGVLIDGQHKLTAIALAGVTIWIFVVTGLAPDVQDTIDGGRKRSPSDVLTLAGEENASALASITRLAWMWDNGDRKFSGNATPTRSEIADYLKSNPSLRRSAQVAVAARKKFPVMIQSATGLCHHLFNRISPDETVWFMERCASGLGLDSGDPEQAFRLRLIKDREEKVSKHPHRQTSMMVSAWNAKRTGRPLARILYIPGEPIKDPK